MGSSRPGLMLPVILSASFMYGFDLNGVNVALPSLRGDLHTGPAALELVAGGYAFTYAAGLVTGGRLGDLFGYRRMFLAGMAAFTVASLLCGVAATPAQLVAARLLQGLTAALMVPQVLALITALYSAERRPRALAWFGVVMAVSGVVGQVLGGLLITADVLGLGWRAIFWVNVPVGAVVLAAAIRLLPRTPPDGRAAPDPALPRTAPDARAVLDPALPRTARRAALDPLGVLGLTGALALALAPLALGREEGWPAWTWVALAAAVPVFALALAWERRLARRGGAPLLDLALFTNRPYRVGLAMSAAFMAAFVSGIFAMSLLLQSGLGLTPLRAGLAFGPMAVGGVVAPLAGRRLIARYGAPRVVLGGSAAAVGGTALLAALLSAYGDGVPVAGLAAALAVVGCANMLVIPALVGIMLAGVRAERAGAASGVLNTTQQFAGSAGLAVIGTVFFAVLGRAHDAGAYAAATAVAFWIAAGLAAVMTGLAVVLRRAVSAGTRVRQPDAGRA